jgi:hypothetical protein
VPHVGATPEGVRGAQRWVHVRDSDDGMVRIELQLRPDEAGRLLKAADISAD